MTAEELIDQILGCGQSIECACSEKEIEHIREEAKKALDKFTTPLLEQIEKKDKLISELRDLIKKAEEDNQDLTLKLEESRTEGYSFGRADAEMEFKDRLEKLDKAKEENQRLKEHVKEAHEYGHRVTAEVNQLQEEIKVYEKSHLGKLAKSNTELGFMILDLQEEKEKLQDIINCIAKFDDSETLANKGFYLDALKRDIKEHKLTKVK